MCNKIRLAINEHIHAHVRRSIGARRQLGWSVESTKKDMAFFVHVHVRTYYVLSLHKVCIFIISNKIRLGLHLW